jgi:hypothetical protein|tara:strand:- start:1076 stop:1315 length:240 start_codon:yes stop_codon:yes gene_type:complete
MKITTEHKILFKEVCSRHNLKEGFISTLFKKRLKSSLLKDKSLQKALADADKELDGLKKHVKDMEKKGMKIPAFLKPYR